jgi:hypothetical protein
MPQSRLHSHSIKKTLTAAPCITIHSTTQQKNKKFPCQSPPCRVPPSHPAKTRDSCCAARKRERKSNISFRATRTRDTDTQKVAAVIYGDAGSRARFVLFFDRCCVTSYRWYGGGCVARAGGWVRFCWLLLYAAVSCRRRLASIDCEFHAWE